MGTVKRLVLILAVATLAVPALSSAGTTSYTAPYAPGSSSTGDGFNYVNADAASGRVSVLRFNPVPTNGGLGCGGSGGMAALSVAHTASSAIQTVTASFAEAAVDPYTFMKLRVRGPNGYEGAANLRGPVAGSGTISVDLSNLSVTGPVTIDFGFEVTSACPNVDGGTARFTQISVVEA